MAKLAVFDFDRTLTDRDTVLGFFRHCHGWRPALPGRLFCFLAAAALAQAGWLDGARLKELGIRLFLSHLDREDIRRRSREYASRIRLNRVYGSEFRRHENPLLLSASFREYLEPLFPGHRIVASELRYAAGRPVGLLRHCHGREKAAMLRECGIERIGAFYTDSIEDLPVVRMSDEIFLVRGGAVLACHSEEEFLRLVVRKRRFRSSGAPSV